MKAGRYNWQPYRPEAISYRQPWNGKKSRDEKCSVWCIRKGIENAINGRIYTLVTTNI